MSHFLVYWKPSTVLLNERCPIIKHSASNQYHKVRIGDVLWIVTSEEPDDLLLIGRQRVDHLVGVEEAEQRLGNSDLWNSEYHALSDDPEDKAILDISKWARKLSFDGVVEELPEGFTGQHLQSMRRLSNDAVRILEKLWLLQNQQESST